MHISDTRKEINLDRTIDGVVWKHVFLVRLKIPMCYLKTFKPLPN